jgi:hypothetical protein
VSAKFSLGKLPAAIKPPASLAVYLEIMARGVQIYTCGTNDKGERAWLHKGPDAELFDIAGKPFGSHYGGPSWEAPDGGKVVGALKASAPAPQSSDIPWLLLDIKSSEGKGVFTQAKAILRVETFGGLAPSAPCEAEHDGATVRVPYTATYLFLK